MVSYGTPNLPYNVIMSTYKEEKTAEERKEKKIVLHCFQLHDSKRDNDCRITEAANNRFLSSAVEVKLWDQTSKYKK